jgi:hypothetical protein
VRYPLPDRMDEAAAQMALSLEEAIFGGGPDRRVEDLRRSILKDEYQPQLQMSGLMYFLDHPVTL